MLRVPSARLAAVTVSALVGPLVLAAPAVAAPGADARRTTDGVVIRDARGDVKDPPYDSGEFGSQTMDVSRVTYNTFWEGGRRMFRAVVKVRDAQLHRENELPQRTVTRLTTPVINGARREVLVIVGNDPGIEFQINNQDQLQFTPKRSRHWVNTRKNEFGFVFSTERFGPFKKLRAQTTTLVSRVGGGGSNYQDPTRFSRQMVR